MPIQFDVPKVAKKVIAIDFDGTIVENAFPAIGRPKKDVIAFIKRHRQKYVWILWTCRSDDKLEDAIKYMALNGITFDYVNENTREHIEKYGTDSRKIYADYYIDDKNKMIERGRIC